jgi:hypothetical protein
MSTAKASSQAPTWTESDLIQRIATRYEKDRGNGPSAVVVRHVKNAAGFAATRCLDAVAVSLYPGQGCPISGFEVKVSRSDWLRELRDPSKAEAFAEHLDFLWLVAPLNVVKDDLPPRWGWLAPVGDGLRVQRQAEPLRPLVKWMGYPAGTPGVPVTPPAVDRAFFVAMMRAARHRPAAKDCSAATAATNDDAQEGRP